MSLAAPYFRASPAPLAAAQGGAATPAVAALLVFAIVLFSLAVLGDGDTWWHLKAGEWILRHASVPHEDPFSFSLAGAPWTAHEWLSEALFALAYHGARWSGVQLLTAIAAAGAIFILATRLARDVGGLALAVATTLAASLLAEDLLARPHVLALPAMAAWCAGLMGARDAGRAPSPLLAPLMALWANLHGGFVFGLALAAALALEAVMEAAGEARRQAIKSWGLFGALALGAALLTPQGVEGLLFPLRLLALKSLDQITEWQPATFAKIEPLETAMLGLLFLALWRPIRLPLIRLLLLLGLVHLSLHHARHQMLLAVLAPMLLARPLAAALDAPALPAKRIFGANSAGLAAVALALALTGMRIALPAKRVDAPGAPISALAATPAALRAQPVLNEYGFGGYLIWAGVRPFIDGRADMYGDAFMERYGRIVAPDLAALDEELARDHIAWTIFSPGTRIVGALDAKPGWRRLYADAFAVIHVRDDAPGVGKADEAGGLRLASPE